MNERLDAEQIRTQLVAELGRLIREQNLSDAAAVERLGLAQDEMSRVRNGEPGQLSIDHLVNMLNELGQRVGVTLNAETGRSLLDKIAEITASVPLEEWDKLPTDLAKNHDHYLYGTPKLD